MDYGEFTKKTLSSESVIHERENRISDKKQPEGYQPHPRESRLSEVFGLKNSFDNISVGLDEKGIVSVTATSQKDYHAPTLTSDRRILKGTRRRTLFEHFGELYTNPFSPKSSAFSFRSRRTVSENRMLSELKRVSAKRLSDEQKQMIPFLTLDEDRERLALLRQRRDEDTADKREKGELEQSIIQKTSLESRFLRRLRTARFQVMPKTENDTQNAFITAPEAALEDGSDDETDGEPVENEEDTLGDEE